MGSEIRSKGKKLEAECSRGLHDKFKRRCKVLNISMAQHLRDLVQEDLKKIVARRIG